MITDACQFNHHSILNVSVEDVTSSTATVRWSTIPDVGLVHGKELLFRVLFDRFGHAFRFPRYVYTDGSDWAVTLQELRPDSTYITCVESVVGGALCQIAPRDHCTGFVTLLPSVTSEVNLQLVTVAALVANVLPPPSGGWSLAGACVEEADQKQEVGLSCTCTSHVLNKTSISLYCGHCLCLF